MINKTQTTHESDHVKIQRLTKAIQSIKILAETYAMESGMLRGEALVQIHKLAIDALTGG